ncbi:hypothetical protein [Calothrix sp. NIES-2098]|uniref:hypothetical protein n=1 Tax=Calothrix sp. NIES-2098 TaxID=1954171 RepID=UPI000B60835E|nr:hypothetical protein NIES2098_69810 [Calothrix sp. NIES-2098]
MTDLITSLAVGEINLVTGLVWFLLAIVLSMVGGAIGGILLGGKVFGYEYSAILGSLFGPTGVIPAIVIGLVVLNLLTN